MDSIPSPPRPRAPRRRRRAPALALALALVLVAFPAAAASGAGVDAGPDAGRGGEPGSSAGAADASWVWPIDPPVIVEPYRAPAHEYAPGHRGIDLRAAPGDPIRAPDAGVVAFAGTVVDRGVVTIDHGGGLVSTLEPVAAEVTAGTVVGRGDPVGVVATGGHTEEGAVHLGARIDGAYVNPLRFLGGVPWAVLLPCC